MSVLSRRVGSIYEDVQDSDRATRIGGSGRGVVGSALSGVREGSAGGAEADRGHRMMLFSQRIRCAV